MFIDIVFIDVFSASLMDFISNSMFFLIYGINTGFWLEIIYRGVILNLLTIKYDKKRAIVLHLVIVYLYSFLMPMSFNLFIFYPGIFDYSINFINFFFSTGLYLIYSLFMGYVFVKSKKLLPNLLISLLLSLLYVTLMIGPIYPIPYYYEVYFRVVLF